MFHVKDAVERMPKDTFSRFRSKIEDDINSAAKRGNGGIKYFLDDYQISHSVLGMAIRDYYVSRNAFFKSKRKKYSTDKSTKFECLIFELESHGYNVMVERYGDPIERTYALYIIWKSGYPISTEKM